MKNVVSSIAAIVVMSAATSAVAQSTDMPAVYGGISLGQSKVQEFCDGAPASVSCDDTGGAVKLFGGYQFHRNFAVELGAGYLGEWTARGPGGVIEIESSAVEALGVAILPIVETVSIYGKAGLYRATTEARANTATLVGTFEESNFDLTVGFGVRFDITRRVGLRAEWQRYFDLGGGDIGEADIDVISVGVLIRF